ncbi:hypothetical protein GIB67_002266 [Kingdonia uniflora]|uniref:MIF4G domain-containing protein n=1 Tax=Kingdonia uniflora TaxID=39325 RepID=A0A7J7KWV0_9MAGN|nr:hypothetical protein GIB67_002266 [Kingdonia uniflora]
MLYIDVGYALYRRRTGVASKLLLRKSGPYRIIRRYGENAYELDILGARSRIANACLDDFSHHNIDVACNLLETCGRFLYRSPETTIRMTNMLEILMRLKNVKNLDPHHSTLVENAYYMCKPPERSARISKVRPPLHQYIRKLLFSDLDKSSIERVLRQLRKLPWSECETYLLKCFMKVHKGKYSQVHMIASLTASLGHYHDEFAIAVVDEVLEEIRLGLELNEYGMQQRRITYMRFLGELYNYQHIDSSVIFETLYLILVFGHGTPEQDALDPPEDYFRIRMVITLLQTCGHYFDRGSSKRKLDRFLIYFQRYILSKGSMPLDIEFDLQDLFADLRPKMRRYMSIDEVNSALVEVEEHEGITLTGKANGRVPTNAIEENGKGHDHAVGDIESDSGSGSVNPGQEGEQELYEDKSEECGSDICDDDGGEAHDPDEENEVKVRQRVVPIDPEEEADFERELRALTQESFESRKLELRTRPTLNMTLPMNVLDHHSRSGVEEELGDEALDEDGSGGNKEVSFKVLVKRGNKQQTKQMLVPRDCKLVRNTKQNEAAESEEKRDINNFIKDYINREEEDLNGIGAPMTNWIQTGISSVTGRGNTWGGSTGGRGGGVRYRNPVHISGGGGLYYGRRK